MPVDIVDNFADAIGVFGKEYRQAACICLNVMDVRWHQSNDLRGKIPLAAVPL
jgi:hypothetical protein